MPLTIEEIAEQGLAAHEQFAADMRALDYAWLRSNRGLTAKPIDEVTIDDVIAARRPFDEFVDRIVDEEIRRANNGRPGGG